MSKPGAEAGEGVSGGASGPENLLQRIAVKPGINTSELVEQCDKPKRPVERWLKQLKDQGLIEFRGAPKTGGYHLTS